MTNRNATSARPGPCVKKGANTQTATMIAMASHFSSQRIASRNAAAATTNAIARPTLNGTHA